ncbi:MAG: DUF1826 domain-containing protein [Pseudomonadota bacterium]
MTHQRAKAVHHTSAAVAIGSEPDVLNEVSDPQIALAIWRRSLPHMLSVCAAASCQDNLHWKGTVHSGDPASQTDCPAALHLLLDDLLQSAEPMRRSCGAEALHVRLETITDDGCRRFHVDQVHTRFVTTYHGAGTEWVSPDWAEACALDPLDYGGPRHTLHQGDVAVFKGAKSGAETLILHRSPPVKSLSEARFVGVADLAW